MCYEPFNRSAADSYIRSMRQQRYETQRRETHASYDGQWGAFFNKSAELLNELDWGGVVHRLWQIFVRYKKFLGIAAAALAILIAIVVLHSPSVRFRAFGHQLTFSFSAQHSNQYLVGFQTDFKSWSEWNHQLD